MAHVQMFHEKLSRAKMRILYFFYEWLDQEFAMY